MHDRVWRFLISPHARDWSFDFSAEMQRTRIGTSDHLFRPDRYYAFIKSQRYQSSRVRYVTISGHARADLATMTGSFAAICAVLGIDRQRQVPPRVSAASRLRW